MGKKLSSPETVQNKSFKSFKKLQTNLRRKHTMTKYKFTPNIWIFNWWTYLYLHPWWTPSSTHLEVVTRSTRSHEHGNAIKDFLQLWGGLAGRAVIALLTGDLTQLLLVVHPVWRQEALLHLLGQADGAAACSIHAHLPQNSKGQCSAIIRGHNALYVSVKIK